MSDSTLSDPGVADSGLADSAGVRDAARQAGLHYADSSGVVITRTRRGRGFSYSAPDGTTITDREERARIEAIVIPPAWTSVWISPDPKGHLSATGRDDRG